MNSPAASAPVVLCIPGPWESRVDFIQRVITLKPEGIYMFAAGFLAHPSAGDHIAADYFGPDPSLAEAFHFAGQGKLEDKTVARIESHRGYAVLWFDGTVASEKQRLVKFTRVLKEIGGYAVKIDSCGVAHEWDEWFNLLNGSAFDLYRGFVSLTADENQFFSRGMHHFELADCAIPRNTPLE
jgi:hypothetical protein